VQDRPTPLRYKREIKDYELRFGLNPCNWAVIENLWQGVLKIEPQSVIDDTISGGFNALDLGDLGFFHPDQVAAQFKDNDIEMMGAFVEVDISKDGMPEEDLKKFDDTARVISQFANQPAPFRAHVVLADKPNSPIRQYNSGRIKPQHEMTRREWKNALKHMDELRKRALERFGVECYLHPHAGTRIETVEEVDRTLDGCDIPIVFDSGHLVYAECQSDLDLLQLLDRWQPRIGTMHYKDIDASVMAKSEPNDWRYFDSVKNGIVPNIGSGCIDFQKITDGLKDKGYKGFVCIEQETFDPSHAAKDAVINRDMIRNIMEKPRPTQHEEGKWGYTERA